MWVNLKPKAATQPPGTRDMAICVTYEVMRFSCKATLFSLFVAAGLIVTTTVILVLLWIWENRMFDKSNDFLFFLCLWGIICLLTSLIQMVAQRFENQERTSIHSGPSTTIPPVTVGSSSSTRDESDVLLSGNRNIRSYSRGAHTSGTAVQLIRPPAYEISSYQQTSDGYAPLSADDVV